MICFDKILWIKAFTNFCDRFSLSLTTTDKILVIFLLPILSLLFPSPLVPLLGLLPIKVVHICRVHDALMKIGIQAILSNTKGLSDLRDRVYFKHIVS